MRISSPAFEHNASIPEIYTCDGEDISPQLEFQDIPEGTRTLVLIMDDPDAPVGVWDHWIYFNLPASLSGLPEDVPGHEYPVHGGTQGLNSWRKLGYGGPCPPSGTHHYIFKLYALGTKLNLKAGAAKQYVLQALDGHVLAEAQLVGTYSRRK